MRPTLARRSPTRTGAPRTVWVTGCNTTGGDEADIDFADGDVSCLWINDNVCGEVLIDDMGDVFVRDNLIGQS